jgi:hypothetical protein
MIETSPSLSLLFSPAETRSRRIGKHPHLPLLVRTARAAVGGNRQDAKELRFCSHGELPSRARRYAYHDEGR